MKREIPLDDLKERFLAIRDAAIEALKEIEECEDLRLRKWRCSSCFQVKEFIRPVALESCGTCPRCGKEAFTPVW
jgi:hypothetical protein